MQRMIAVIVTLLSIGILTFAQNEGPIIVNEHDGLEPFTSVIENPEFNEGDYTLILVNGRIMEIPAGWSFTANPLIGGLPPYIKRGEEPGLEFLWEWINGQAGLAQDGIQLYGNQRYAIQVEYLTDLFYTSDQLPFVPSDFQVYARLYTASGGMIELPRINSEGLEQSHSVEWVIESVNNPYPFVRLEVMFDVEWPQFRGSVFAQRMDIVTVADDYRPNAVINFE
ncbi:MAG: hypothetical protein Phog2KO_34380 [Phototrophicaceae bacterium]